MIAHLKCSRRMMSIDSVTRAFANICTVWILRQESRSCFVLLQSCLGAAFSRSICMPWCLLDDASRIPSNHRIRRHVLIILSQNVSFQHLQVVPTFVTTLPAPTVDPLPTRIPGKMIAFPPIQQSSSMLISPPISGPLVPFLTSGSSGWVPEYSETFAAIKVLAPILTLHVSRMVQLKLMKTLSPSSRFVP